MGVIVCSIISTHTVKIQIDDDGLFLKCNFKESNYTVVWECDAGTLSRTMSDTDYTVLNESTYYLYSGLDEKIAWSPVDNDGFSYTTATIKIYVYKYSENNRYSKCDDKVYTDTLTISIENRKITKSEKREFGNPIRQGLSDDWEQILVLDEQKGYVTLRYRYGRKLKSSERIVWSTNVAPLCKSVFYSSPVFVPESRRNREKFIYNTDTVCYNFTYFDNFYFDDTDIEEHPANIKIQAFIEDKRGVQNSKTSISMKYYYGYDSHYSIDPVSLAKN